MKRFYKLVSMQPVLGGFTVLLDGKSFKTPARNQFLAPNEAIASVVVREWAGQGEAVIPDAMPFTQFIVTKIDRVATERAAMTANLLKYIDTDLLCYRTDEPPELAKLQKESWDPWLQWFEENFGVALQTTQDLKALRQPPAAHEKVQEFLESLDDDRFTILQLAAVLSGSLIMAMAFTRQAATAEQVFAAARVEESYKAALYNEEKYGPDPLQDKKDKAALRDLGAASDFLSILS